MGQLFQKRGENGPTSKVRMYEEGIAGEGTQAMEERALNVLLSFRPTNRREVGSRLQTGPKEVFELTRKTRRHLVRKASTKFAPVTRWAGRKIAISTVAARTQATTTKVPGSRICTSNGMLESSLVRLSAPSAPMSMRSGPVPFRCEALTSTAIRPRPRRGRSRV